MTALLLRIEAIESRIASYSCPAGTSGRVHALRLRRCLQRSNHCRHTASAAQASAPEQSAPTYSTAKGRVEENAPRRRGVGGDPLTRRLAELRDLRIRHSYFQGNGIWDPFQVGTKVIDYTSSLAEYQKPLQLQYNENGNAGIDSQEAAQLVERLRTSLRSGDPNCILEEVLAQMRAVGPREYARSVFGAIPASTFSEILLALDPKHFLSQLPEMLVEVSPSSNERLKLPLINIDGHQTFLTLFLEHISTILHSRASIYTLSITDYKFLLKSTRVTGDSAAAKAIWKNLQQQVHGGTRDSGHERLTLDVECYNHYVAALCWSEKWNSFQRHRLRVSPRNFLPRTWEGENSGHFISLRGHSVGAGGLKQMVASSFREMLQQKVQPDEETFCLMIISAARERDLGTMASILKRVWGIDVEKVLTTDDSENLPNKLYQPSDPLYPSSNLLMTLAHAYAINNSITAAIRLVDYTARQYVIPISRKVWSELLERTYMLSSRRGRSNPMDGQLPRVAVSNLWKTMTGEPYNIRPDMKMYNFLIPSLIKRQRYGEVQTRMQEAMQKHRDDVSELANRVQAFNGIDPDELHPHVLAQRAKHLSLQHLRVKINRQYIRRWVQLLVRHGSRDLDGADVFATLNVPDIVKEWSLFLPRVLRYRAPSGQVSLNTQSQVINQRRQSKYMETNERWITAVRESGRLGTNGQGVIA